LVTDILTSIEASGLAKWVRESLSIWSMPMIITAHTVGLALLVGSSWAFGLRVLGVARSIPLAALRTLFPVMWAGFWINAVTGALLFSADAVRRATSPLFLTKMAFVAVGMATLVLIRRHIYGKAADSNHVDGKARVLAIVSIVVWAAAITAGRLLAYLVDY
jgi:hypothetical protein